MKRSDGIGLVLLAIVLSSFILVDSNRIAWTPDKRVEWFDYQGHPDHTDNFRDAVTTSAINYTTRCIADDKLEVIVKAEFLKDKSWVKSIARTDYQLGHERLHFDITELYVRKLRAELQHRHFTCGEEGLVDAIASKVLSDWRGAQLQYDKESMYSLDKHDQHLWEQKVAKELIDYGSFASE